jgi:hypothetical protein
VPTAGKSNWIGGICVAPNHEASAGTVDLAHPDAAAVSFAREKQRERNGGRRSDESSLLDRRGESGSDGAELSKRDLSGLLRRAIPLGSASPVFWDGSPALQLRRATS